MKLVRVSKDEQWADGILDGDEVTLVGDWQSAEAKSFGLSRMSLSEIAEAAKGPRKVKRKGLKLELPIDARNKIICVGVNYLDHVGEVMKDAPEKPALFLRHPDSLVGPEDALVAPTASPSFDYEGEIAVIIGRVGRDIAPERAMDHVLGYSCFMDGSVRAFQKHSVTAGKNFWRSGAMGPWIVTRDEVSSPSGLKLETRVNGEVLQSTSSDLMIFDIPAIIAYCSVWTELRPGDVIATGTPAGVGLYRSPPRWLKAGETVEVTVSSIGTLRNPIVAQP